MKSLIVLVVNLAVSAVVSHKPSGPIMEVGDGKSIVDANGGIMDDILEPPNVQRSAIIEPNKLWTTPIPYVLDKGLDANAKGVTLRAMEQFRLKSCIDFKPRDSEEYYISVVKLNGCFSYVGKSVPNGQNLSIGTYCDEISTVEHEFLHALGFYHEQSRYDRDDYVTIVFPNIQTGRERNFEKVSSNKSTTNGVAYDYWSVMHYGKNAFTNGNGSTIITSDPNFQDVIGQRYEVSPNDVLELNRHYKCNSTIAFKIHCNFSDGNMCQMNKCSDGGIEWQMMTNAYGGPGSDHTNLPSGSGHHGQGAGYFMHASTASGQEGDSAWLETEKMIANRECHVQCLQFYYYHNGSQSDQLNIWIREFQNELDQTGTRRLVGQITGQRTTHWQSQHVSLNATKHFQVVFEVRKGKGSSSGGFSIDDINVSETECPHFTMQIDDFESLLNNSAFGTDVHSTQLYSRGGYSYRVGILMKKTYVSIYVQLLSGIYDDQLEWPCPQRQVTFQMVDQNPDIQQQMTKQASITSDLRTFGVNGSYFWGNPREVGTPFTDENNETSYAGPMISKVYFADAEEIKYREFVKGESIVFAFTFEDLTPLINGSALPCPEVSPAAIEYPPPDVDEGPCARISTTSLPPQTTDGSIFGFAPGLVASPVLGLLLPALMLLIL